jgi:tetratricopeptide (TPR) repeat protein
MRRTDAHVPHTLLKAALSLHEEGKFEEAEKVYRSVPRSSPEYCSALTLLGTLCLQRGRNAEGITLIKRSLAINPQQPTAYNSLGNAFRDLGQYTEALDNYDQTVALSAEFAEAWYNRGVVLNELARYLEAIESYGRATVLRPTYAKAYNNRGNAFNDLGRYDEALMDYDRALALRPNDATIYSNRALALGMLNRYDEALASCARAIEIDRHYPLAYVSLGMIYSDLKRYDEALASCERALALDPACVNALLFRAELKLLLGDWAGDAWEAYELRWKKPAHALQAARYCHTPWTGEDNLSGKTILIWSDQGLGDTVLGARYVPMLEALGAKVYFEVQASLVDLLSTVSQSVNVLARGDDLPECDFQCSVMSLPRAFKTTTETVPATVPYLRVGPNKQEFWRAKLGAKKKPRVGIVWSGSGRMGKRPTLVRDIPFSGFQRLIQPDFDYFVLQQDVRPCDAEPLASRPEVRHFQGMLETFSDTAALVAEMDLIISVDTSVAHLAGALAKPLWLLLPHPPQPFMTVLGRKDCPWYPTARIFRQSQQNDWSLVIDQVIKELHNLELFS